MTLAAFSSRLINRTTGVFGEGVLERFYVKGLSSDFIPIRSLSYQKGELIGWRRKNLKYTFADSTDSCHSGIAVLAKPSFSFSFLSTRKVYKYFENFNCQFRMRNCSIWND